MSTLTRRKFITLLGTSTVSMVLFERKNLDPATRAAIQEDKLKDRIAFEKNNILPTVFCPPSKNHWSVRLILDPEKSLYTDPYGGQVKLHAGEGYVIAQNSWDRLFHYGKAIRLSAYETLDHRSVGKLTVVRRKHSTSYLLPHERHDIVEFQNIKNKQTEWYEVERNPKDKDKFWLLRLEPHRLPGIS